MRERIEGKERDRKEREREGERMTESVMKR